MCRRPEKGLFQAPQVDDVTDQKQVLGLNGTEELAQGFGVTAAKPEVNIGDEDTAWSR